MRRYVPIGLILIAFLTAGALYALFTPDWQAPDEPAHYNYIKQLADGVLPIIEKGDYDQEYQNLVISSGFASQYSVDPFRYEDYQPPLYYALLTPVYMAFDGSLTALRLSSLLLGAGVVLLTYMIGVSLFPERKWLAVMAAAFVAFLPQHVAMLAAVNNDTLAELLIAGILLTIVSIILPLTRTKAETKDYHVPSWKWLLLGLLLGLGLITKVTVYILVPVAALALIWAYWGNWRSFWRSVLLVFGPAIVIGFIWWIRNILVYDAFDPIGNLAHNSIVVGQPRSSEWIETFGITYLIRNLIQTTFQSFWGQFGWMGVPMPGWVYIPLALFSLLAAAGLGWLIVKWARRGFRSEDPGDESFPSILAAVLVLLFLLSAATFIGYNLTFVQHQGRYLFPALIPISLGAALGISAVVSPYSEQWPLLLYAVPFTIAAALFVLDLFALFRFIVPTLT